MAKDIHTTPLKSGSLVIMPCCQRAISTVQAATVIVLGRQLPEQPSAAHFLCLLSSVNYVYFFDPLCFDLKALTSLDNFSDIPL